MNFLIYQQCFLNIFINETDLINKTGGLIDIFFFIRYLRIVIQMNAAKTYTLWYLILK